MGGRDYKQARMVFDTFCDMLDKKEGKYNKDEEDLSITFSSIGKDFPWRICVNIDVDRELIRLRSPLAHVPEDKRIEAALAICAINDRMINGCFDYDYTDGEIVFRMANSYAGSIVGEEVCDYMVRCAGVTIDEYNDLLALYMLGVINLEELIERVN